MSEEGFFPLGNRGLSRPRPYPKRVDATTRASPSSARKAKCTQKSVLGRPGGCSSPGLPCAPAAELGNIGGPFEAIALADKSRLPATIREFNLAQRQRSRNATQERAEFRARQLPDFDRDRGARTGHAL